MASGVAAKASHLVHGEILDLHMIHRSLLLLQLPLPVCAPFFLLVIVCSWDYCHRMLASVVH